MQARIYWRSLSDWYVSQLLSEMCKLSVRSFSFTRIVYFVLKDIDECVNHTCQNGGSCLDGVNNYSCNCLPGYTGSLCETGRYFAVPALF